jgi:high-affinity nickel-transport protein
MALVIFGLLGSGTLILLAAAPHHYRVSSTTVFGFGTGFLALTLGMRHAFDADHIAAIDNTTRSMMAEGQRPLSVGFFFSLGHSSVVFTLTTLLALGLRGLGSQVTDQHSSLHRVTGVVGTSVSGIFLLLIAAINVVIFRSILSAFADLRQGHYNEEEIEQRLAQRGVMNRILTPAVKRVDTPWKMYPLGLLFGLGFDTATEVGLLVLSGSAVASGLPLWAIFSLPLLFAGGMSLLDTIDGCFMNFAYGWAFSKPVRKVYYNLVITGLSIAVAALIGTIEVAGLVIEHLNLHGGVFDLISSLNLNMAGFVVVGLFVVTWIVALVVWRVGRLEERFDHPRSATSLVRQGER